MSGTDADGHASTDAAVIRASLTDAQTFSLLVDRHASAVHRYLASRVDRSTSEDLLADVFLAAFQGRERYDQRYDNALPWLLGIATNMLRHHHRSERRRSLMLQRITSLDERTIQLSSAFDSVQTGVEVEVDMQCVQRALRALDDSHREVLVLAAGLGLSYAEIARTLHIRIGTVRSRLSRARRKLRELLEADGQYTVKAGHRHPEIEERST